MSIPSNYQSLSGFRTAYTETELRLAIAIAEAFIENDLGSGGGGGGGAVTANQGGTWNINNVSGAISLPTGASTESTLADFRDNFSSGLEVSGVASAVANTDLLTNTVNGWFDAGEYQSIAFQVIGSGTLSGGFVFFEQTNDNTAIPGAALFVQELSSSVYNSNPVAGTTQNIPASGSRWFGCTRNCRYVRVRISGTPSAGNMRCIAYLSKFPFATPIVTAVQATAAFLKVDGSGTTQSVSGTITAVGNVAAAATDSGNPVKVGGVYNTTRPTYTNGQRGNIEISARGGILADFEDYVTNPNNINTADAGSSTVSGANSQNIITGTPTNNSTVSALFSGNSSFAVLISGTWVGTLQFERTLDGGTTWTSVGAFSAGTNFITQTTTANGAFHGNSSSSNGIRVRATAWTSGVASVRILLGQGTGTITIGNPIRLFDSVNNAQATIRGSSSAPAATDTAIVTSPRIETISPTLFQITLTNANTEYSQAITSAKKILFKVLSGGDIRYAYVTGRVATPTSPYYTLNSLSEESEDFPGNDRFTGTLYLASATAGTIVIAKVWG